MFRRSASLAIPHLKSFAAIPSVSLVLLGHANRSVFLSHESQREIALVYALSRPIPYYQQGEVAKKNGPVFRKVCVFEVSRAVGIARFESVPEAQPNRTIQLGVFRMGAPESAQNSTCGSIPRQHDFPHLLHDFANLLFLSLRNCQIIIERVFFFQKCKIIFRIIFQIIFKMIFVKFGMLCSSCRAHMWQQNAHTENTQDTMPLRWHPKLMMYSHVVGCCVLMLTETSAARLVPSLTCPLRTRFLRK